MHLKVKLTIYYKALVPHSLGPFPHSLEPQLPTYLIQLFFFVSTFVSKDSDPASDVTLPDKDLLGSDLNRHHAKRKEVNQPTEHNQSTRSRRVLTP